MPAVAGVQNAALLTSLFGVVVVGHAEVWGPGGAAEVPRAAKVVLAAGPADAWFCLAIHEEVVVSLAPPAVRVRHDRDERAHIVARALDVAECQILADRSREVGAV